MGFRVLGVLALLASTLFLAGCSSTPTDEPSFSRRESRPRTVAEVVANTPGAEERLVSYFLGAGVHYPPQRVAMLGFKAERRLELWADDGRGWKRITNYYVQGASGGPGPKLLQGDRQVPEGLYQISYLNPNSCCHLSLKINYPNAFDLHHATLEGRTNPGGDIFIHGGRGSSGCLAVGNPSVEELFVLVARIGLENTEVILAPHDFRQSPVQIPPGAPRWTGQLYRQVQGALARFPAS